MNVSRSTATLGHEPSWTTRPLWQVGLAAGLVAAMANVLVYALARAADVPMELTEVFSDEFERMPLENMVFGTLLEGALAGIALAAACRRWANHPRVAFVALAAIGTIASLAAPFATDATTATGVVLSISHIAAAAVIVPPLALALPTHIRQP